MNFDDFLFSPFEFIDSLQSGTVQTLIKDKSKLVYLITWIVIILAIVYYVAKPSGIPNISYTSSGSILDKYLAK
jgi:hypothetical protein